MLVIAIVMLTIMLVFVIAVLFPGVIASGADGTQRGAGLDADCGGVAAEGRRDGIGHVVGADRRQ